MQIDRRGFVGTLLGMAGIGLAKPESVTFKNCRREKLGPPPDVPVTFSKSDRVYMNPDSSDPPVSGDIWVRRHVSDGRSLLFIPEKDCTLYQMDLKSSDNEDRIITLHIPAVRGLRGDAGVTRSRYVIKMCGLHYLRQDYPIEDGLTITSSTNDPFDVCLSFYKE